MAAQMGLTFLQATIAAGQSISGQIDIGPYQIVGIYIPATWTGSATQTFQVSYDGGSTWFEHYSYSGSETVFGAISGTATYLAIDPTLWRGVASLKIRSGTPASPVNQSGSVTLTLAVKMQ